MITRLNLFVQNETKKYNCIKAGAQVQIADNRKIEKKLFIWVSFLKIYSFCDHNEFLFLEWIYEAAPNMNFILLTQFSVVLISSIASYFTKK